MSEYTEGPWELEESLEMMSRMYSETYNEALKFKEQRDKLLRVCERLISTIDNVCEPEIIENEVRIFKKTVNGIKGGEGND